MSDQLMLAAVKNLGVAGVGWLVFYIYHKASIAIITRQIANERSAYEQLLAMHIGREKDWSAAYAAQNETLQYVSGLMSRVESKIDANAFCPIVRKETGK
jgi:hypothetical protein